MIHVKRPATCWGWRFGWLSSHDDCWGIGLDVGMLGGQLLVRLLGDGIPSRDLTQRNEVNLMGLWENEVNLMNYDGLWMSSIGDRPVPAGCV